jgi:chromosome segregation ATPase
MNRWIWIAIGAVLLASAQCAASREAFQEKQEAARLKHIQDRKEKERKYAERIVRNTQLQTTRKKQRRSEAAQAEVERKELAATQDTYRDEVRHFTALTQELALPVYTDRPLTDIIHEAQLSLEKINTYNPKVFNVFQAQLERALRVGKHPMNADGTKLYPNTQLIAQQSVQSLVDYTQHAQEFVEQTASQAQETACSMAQTLQEYRIQIAELMNQLNESERRFQSVDAQLTKLNQVIKKGEIEITQKEAEAVNLAQCIDTFTTASSKLSQDRINQAESLVRSLEQKAHLAEQQTTLLMLRLQETEKAMRSVENLVQGQKNKVIRN